ncbi:probable serine/threonine-protein kinase DDB_G0282963 isoform X2 [Condylostylus longicornis]|uniref:probable serine/threonine-protein kinase DDB_G0282963 isoform X2 n=1 Tax=Condylostylus longicornis TaxID=2530218 RepID=UPI00244DF986|nr:probable serine/threonine-protein kinase DDB_G0282963 isoform X2 [Condylostylus longicornis]
MEVAIGSNNSGTPFQREIREWQRIDPNTGALLTGRLEADRWISGPLNAYGKVVDSQNVSQPNGTQHTQRKQLEVLQAHTSSGSMQVIRAQTVQTTSSRWSSSTSSSSKSTSGYSNNNSNNNILSSSSTAASTKLKSITSSSSAHATNKSNENEFNNNKNNYNNNESNKNNNNSNIISKKQFKSPITNGFSATRNDSNSIIKNNTTIKSSSSIINNGYNNNNGNINGDYNQIHHNSHQENNLYKKQQQNHEHEYNIHQYQQQKSSNLQSYNLQMMSTTSTTATSDAIQLNETTKITATNNINGHDHHLNSHNNNKNNHKNNNCNDLNNCGNSSNINDQHSTISTVIASATVFTNIEPSLKLSNLMKSSQSNNNDRSSPHSFTQINKNSINNFSVTSAATAAIAATTTIKTQKDQNKSISIVQKVQQQHQQQQQQKQNYEQQNQFENGITSSPSTSTISSSSSSSPPSSSSLLFSSSTSSAITSATIASAHSFCNNSSNNRTIQQNSHHFKQQQKDIQQKQQQQSPHIINQPTLINSNSNCVGVKGITEVGGFKHNNNSSSLITNGGGDVEDMTMDQRGKYSDFNFERSRSASTDDLSIDWDEHNQAETDETCEWRRVSKIRRSFQFPKTNSPPKSSPFTRPTDLPENCVSVSRIREELEKGRRLNVAMSHNIVDLQAMENILNGSNINDYDQDSSKSLKKSPSFLTAESLKEIRGKLKKLSDESLYKDDFVTSQSINNDSNRISSLQNHDSILNGMKMSKDSPLSSQMILQQSAFQYYPKNSQQINHTTNSLENRATRLKDTSSADWHIRRKSYGFEKMSPPDNKMFRMENSTDSGLGRSSDLGNLSPTEHRGTVITFNDSTGGGGVLNGTNKNATTVILNGDKETINSKPLVQRRYRDPNKINSSSDEASEVKRHSIAVDETKYVRENLRKVFDSSNSTGTTVSHLNRLYLKEDNGSTSISLDESQRNQRKRVEFCKTEVHFAAESGRVNIVETDGKPPPSNNFRRRRRSSGNAYIDAITSGLQVTHFGDESRSKSDTQEQAEQNKNENSSLFGEKSSVTVSIPSVFNEQDISSSTTANNYMGKTSPDDEDQDEISLRGILKNKPVKPKPYHLGENSIGNDNLWGVKLKSVTGNDLTETAKSKSLIRNLEEHDYEKEKLSNSKSVAEHVRIVEERKDVNGSYSTKINLNLTDKPFTWNSETSPSSPSIDIHKTEQNDTHESGIQNLIPINARFRIIDTTAHNNNTITSSPTSTAMTKTIQDLKSTSLIMRTIRPIPQYERQNSEPTKIIHLNASFQPQQQQQQQSSHLTNLTANVVASGYTTATKLISNMTAITKSNSANNILSNSSTSSFALTDTASSYFRKKYSSSLDGETVLNEDHIYRGGKVLKSSSFESAMVNKNSPLTTINLIENASKRFSTIDNRLTVDSTEDEIKKPVAIPRKSSTRPRSMGSFPSNHNSHLGRISEMIHNSDLESDDSVQAADEEVKRYLSNELLDQLDENENSNEVVANSWNRLKAEKSTIKSEKIDFKDIPKSNVMSIKLQSPQPHKKEFTNVHESSKNMQTPMPVAKPRTSIQTLKNLSSTNDCKINKNPIKVSPLPSQSQLSPNKLPLETLKVEPNGTRKLREHELLYFGVKINNEDELNQHHINNFNNSKSRNQPIQSSINETNRKLQNNPKIIEETTGNPSKWKLACDKPDLLRHSPMEKTQNNVPMILNPRDQKLNQITKTNGILMQDEDTEEDEDEDEDAYVGPIYENLKLPYPYNRKDDLIRDAMILSEMNKAADQTMKTVIDAHKIQKRRERRRSEQLHQSQPLDTIEEKMSPSSRLSHNQHESEKSYLQQTENSQRRSSLSRRSSSASSTGSFSDSGSICGRSSRSRSKEKLLDSTDSPNKLKSILVNKVRPRTSRPSKECTSIKSPIAVSVRRIIEHRSSSQESQRSHKNSNENLQIVPPQKLERRHKRQTSTPTKATTTSSSEKYHKNSSELSRYRSDRSSTESNERRRTSKSSRNQTGISSPDGHNRKTHSNGRTTTNSDPAKRINSRSNKEASNSENHKTIRSSARITKELRDSEGRSASEHRRNRSSHDRKETSERHVSSRGLKTDKEDYLRSSTRSDRATRATSLDNLRSSKRSQKLEESNKITRSKDKLSSNGHEHHKSSSTNKTSIQHGTKTATIPPITSTTASNGHQHGTTKHSSKFITTSSDLSSSTAVTAKHKEQQRRKKSKERQSRN